MNKKTFILIIFFGALLFPRFFCGAETTELAYPVLPGVPTDPTTGGNNFFAYAFSLAILGGIVIAAMSAAYQGITILFSSGNVAKITDAKDGIRRALVGLVILLGSYAIIASINPEVLKINLPSLQSFNAGTTPTPGTTVNGKVTYMEIPLGSVIESILAANSSTTTQRSNYSHLLSKGEEKCYMYDANGDTIDRNNDNAIDDRDLFEGLDMSYCIDGLLKATVIKIKLLNSTNSAGVVTACNGTDGPINEMKESIKRGCNCNNCKKTNYTIYKKGECAGACSKVGMYPGTGCICCGSGAGQLCTSSPSALTYPCDNMQDIRCNGQEISYRLTGSGNPKLKCSLGFVQADGTVKATFLTIQEAQARLQGFNSYYANRITDLKTIENSILLQKSNTDYNYLYNYLSLAEFQTLQAESKTEIEVSRPVFPINYDIIEYCKSFNCTAWRTGDPTKDDKTINKCSEGELQALVNPGDKYFSPGYPEAGYLDKPKGGVTTKRLCDLLPDNKTEAWFRDGDPLTFYRLENPGTTDPKKYSDAAKAGMIDYSETKEKCTLDTTIERGYMKSLIPISQLVSKGMAYAEEVQKALNQTSIEVQGVITEAQQLVNAPDECNCSNCKNGLPADPITGYEGETTCYTTECGGISGGTTYHYCRDCKINTQQSKCLCCGETDACPDIAKKPQVNIYNHVVTNVAYCHYALTLLTGINPETGKEYDEYTYASACPCPGNPAGTIYKNYCPNYKEHCASNPITPLQFDFPVTCTQIPTGDYAALYPGCGTGPTCPPSQERDYPSGFHFHSYSIVTIDPAWVQAHTEFIPQPKDEEGLCLTSEEYYLCPFRKIAKSQCKIFRPGSFAATATNAEEYAAIAGTSVSDSCSAGDPGHLKRVQILQTRLQDIFSGKATDVENRWEALDLLNIVRDRLEKCVQGYGMPYKEDLAKTRLFSCEEGVSAIKMNSYVVLPSFPYPQLSDRYNCFPLNADDTIAAKCFANKDRTGAGNCQDLIKGYINDYYCCQGTER
ncbi:MAG: hypothetical protein WC520_04235 [Candidatus Paceibacterota bacterium]